MFYAIFADGWHTDGLYIITNNLVINGSLTWAVSKENIIEVSGDIDPYLTSFNRYVFPKLRSISGEANIDTIYYKMVEKLFSHGNKLRGK